ncbi:nucleolar protein dao-5 [Patella vulgata]|uniref:nucleolar protein dao-5 n=1 Tax=Patella vulgata TaxID=6465 RepID=UPI0024A9DFB4|nr:nucleolar protein dao-5 [Patella vulgata]XP_050397215.2 nucleolar protein dao-5 [Patella vulgata]
MRQSSTVTRTSTSRQSMTSIQTVTVNNSTRGNSRELFYEEFSTLSPPLSQPFLQLDDSSFTSLSPGWVRGHAGLFESPKSISPKASKTRRSSVYSNKTTVSKSGNESSVFKKPGEVFISPTGVKTRARRSSIYQKSGKNLLSGLSTQSRRESMAAIRARKYSDYDSAFALPKPDIANRRKVVSHKRAQGKKSPPKKKSPQKEETNIVRRSRSKAKKSPVQKAAKSASKIIQSQENSEDDESAFSPRRTRKTPSKRPMRSLSSMGKSDKKRKRSPSKSPSSNKKRPSPIKRRSPSKSPSQKSPIKKGSSVKSPSPSKKQQTVTKKTPSEKGGKPSKFLEVSLMPLEMDDSICYNSIDSSNNILNESLSSKRSIHRSSKGKSTTRLSGSFKSSPKTPSQRSSGKVSETKKASTPISSSKKTSKPSSTKRSPSPKKQTIKKSPPKPSPKKTSPSSKRSTPKSITKKRATKISVVDSTKLTNPTFSVIASSQTDRKTTNDIINLTTFVAESVEKQANSNNTKSEKTSPKSKTPLSTLKMKSILDSVTSEKTSSDASNKKRKTTDFLETESANKRRRFDRDRFEKIVASTPRDMRLDILSGRRPELSPIVSANKNMNNSFTATKQVTVFSDKTTFLSTGPSNLSPIVSKSPSIFQNESMKQTYETDNGQDEVDGDNEFEYTNITCSNDPATTEPYLFDYDTDLDTSHSNIRPGCTIL